MSPEMILELVGYFASMLVLVSLLMTSVMKLRIINGIGSLIFAIYAVLIHSYPTAVMNFCLVGIDLYFLLKLRRTHALFSLLEAGAADPAVEHFTRFYGEDIRNFFPEYTRTEGTKAYLVYADAEPVGLMLGTPDGTGGLTVALDYSAPKYRDCSVGTYLYGQLPGYGIRRLTAAPGPQPHNAYLEKMGFTQEDGQYVRKL